MKRGDVWTVSGGKDYAGKPRPVVIVQSDLFASLDSVTVCGFTTDLVSASLLRVPVVPTPGNGLRMDSRIMVDKIVTVPRSKLGARLGRLEDAHIRRLDLAILVFLGLAESPPPASSATSKD